MAHGDKELQPSLTASRTIALVAFAVGLLCACGIGPQYKPPPPPDLVTVTTGFLSFHTAIGQASETQQIGIANISPYTAPLGPRAEWLSSAKNNPFTYETDCGPSLAPQSSCTISVKFLPAGTKTANDEIRLRIQRDETHIVKLKGTVDTQP
jgi:hypothetical protein